MTTKELITDIRFGFKETKSLTDGELVKLMDFNLPPDVLDLCLEEIRHRRNKRLSKHHSIPEEFCRDLRYKQEGGL